MVIHHQIRQNARKCYDRLPMPHEIIFCEIHLNMWKRLPVVENNSREKNGLWS